MQRALARKCQFCSISSKPKTPRDVLDRIAYRFSTKMSNDIEDIHQRALTLNSTTYVDPQTGLTVFSEIAHLNRGACCGNQCRHCPYGWVNVAPHLVLNTEVPTRRCESGNPDSVKARLTEIALTFQDDADETDSNRPRRIRLKSERKTGGRYGGKRTSKNVPYTRTGDKGTAVLLTGERQAKNSPIFEAMGTVDELCAVVGLSHAELLSMEGPRNDILLGQLVEVMSRLFDIGSHVAKPRRACSDEDDSSNSSDSVGSDSSQVAFTPDGIGGGFDPAHVEELEDWVDDLTEELPELLNFILPTGTRLSALLHQARVVCRRAERTVVPLVKSGTCDPQALAYLNRLSDYLFSAARKANADAGVDEFSYRKPQKTAKQRVVVETMRGN